MPKKDMTPEERKAWGAKMKAAREAKKQAAQTHDDKETIDHNDDLQVLKRRIEELEQRQFFTQPPTSTKRIITKYSFDPKAYPDPRERLILEDRLKRFAFAENYELNWEVQKIDYEEDGDKVRAPRFLLELLVKMVDPETNEIARTQDPKTGEWKEQRYVRRRGMFFEDPDSFIAAANQMNIDVPEFLEKDFLDEMRYLVMRDWLFEYFFPPNNLRDKTERKELVIDNRLVEVFEISSDVNNPTPKMPFKD
jgi:hypothetical protein